MQRRWQINKIIFLILLIGLFLHPWIVFSEEHIAFDSTQLVERQVEILKNRYAQAEHEWDSLKQQHEPPISSIVLERTSKKFLDKASLGVLVAQSNLESINIELNDTQQTVTWLEKNIQETKNQLNVLGIFGLKIKNDEIANIERERVDLALKQQLLALEKERADYLQRLHSLTRNILQSRKDNYARLSAELQSYRMLNIKQQQIQDESAYQALQYRWLQQLNELNVRINQTDPAKAKATYLQLERDIFYANENANLAYVQSMIVRYKDQTQQLKLAMTNTNAINILNAINDQVSSLNKQMAYLNTVLQSHIHLLTTHIHDLSRKKSPIPATRRYIQQLVGLNKTYHTAQDDVIHLQAMLSNFRIALDRALQTELAARQGFPILGFKTVVNLGKEILLVPTLTYHVLMSVSAHLLLGIAETSLVAWTIFILAQASLLFLFYFLKKMIISILEHPFSWHGKINSRWLSLQWLRHNSIEFFVIGEMVFIMRYFGVALPNYVFIIYLLFVWLVFKSVLTILYVCLVEATDDTTGHDMRLYKRLKWIILAGEGITALTVFLHQLPLIYELKMLCDRLFLLFLMVVSLLLLRTSSRIPRMILSHMEAASHPYFEKSILLIAFLVPMLILVNAAIGLFGYVNLVMTVSGYEGIFLIVLIGYLIARGLLADLMEYLSKLVIHHARQGWLMTEAFLKPIDKVLQIVLFLTAWFLLFVWYGWDKQSPVVERLNNLLNYTLINVLNTTITPIDVLELFVVISIFYWCARWTREFVYRLLFLKTKDMGIRNSLAILSQYTVVVVGLFICLRVLGIDLRALTFVATAFAFGIGLGLRDLANNFASGFLILLERPIRVGDIVSIENTEGKVMHIGSRAVTIRTWDNADLVVPNTEIFNKSFTNWTFKDNVVRCKI